MCGTKTESTSDTKQHTAFNYDPTAMKAYTGGINTASKLYTDWANQPFNNMSYQMDVTQGTDMAAKLGQRGINNVTQNARAGGYGDMNMPGFQASMLNRAGRDTGSLQAQAMRQAAMNAIQKQMYGAGELFHFQPLMQGTDTTGHSTSTQQTSGLGTWLPQIAGAAIGAGMGALTGGASMAAGAAGKAGGGIGGASGLSMPSWAGASSSSGGMWSGGFNPTAFSGAASPYPNPFQ